MSCEKALDLLTRDFGFKASVYAMKTLLIDKGVYTQKEFQELFVEWALKEQRTLSKAIKPTSKISV